jgi:hypothetical protein
MCFFLGTFDLKSSISMRFLSFLIFLY